MLSKIGNIIDYSDKIQISINYDTADYSHNIHLVDKLWNPN